jgi:hypothetical protein
MYVSKESSAARSQGVWNFDSLFLKDSRRTKYVPLGFLTGLAV